MGGASAPSCCCNSVTRANVAVTAGWFLSAAARMNLASASRNSCSTVVMLATHSFKMFAAFLAGPEIPEQPIVVGNKLPELAVPFPWEFVAQLLQERQQRPLRLVAALVFVERDLILPAQLLSIRRETKPIEEILAAHERDVPQTRDG